MIKDSRLESALTKIAKTDELAAELHMKCERAEYRAKAVRDAIFLRTEGTSVSERQAKAGNSPEYSTAMDEYFAALQAYDTIKNERSREFLIVEVWRTESANARKGNP